MKLKATMLTFLMLLSLILPMFAFLPIEKTHAVAITRTRRFEIEYGEDDAAIFGRSTSYATARTTATSGEWGIWLSVGQNFAASQYTVYRGFMKFDTSRIPDTATILSAKLCLYGQWDQSATDFVIRIQKWTGDTPITTGDYNEFDGVNYDDGSFNTNRFVEWGWNNITITNFSIINLEGYTKICLRSSRDIGSNPPTGAEFVQFFTKDWLGNKPAYLEITYSFPPPVYTVIPNWLVGGEDGYLVAVDLPVPANYTGYADGFETGDRAAFWEGGIWGCLYVTSETDYVKSGFYGARSSPDGYESWYYNYATREMGTKTYYVSYKIVPSPQEPNLTDPEFFMGVEGVNVGASLWFVQNRTGVFLQSCLWDGTNERFANGTHILSSNTWYDIRMTVSLSATSLSINVYVNDELDSAKTISGTFTGEYYVRFSIQAPSFSWRINRYECMSAIDNFAENQIIKWGTTKVDDLTDVLGTTFDISTLRNGYGFYLLGLEDEPLGVYEGPKPGARIVKYAGEEFTNVAPSVQGVQIMDIARYRSKFLIGGYYKSTGGSYGYGRLYTYDGQTFTDVTTQILGSDSGPMVMSLADCDRYWLIGTFNSEQACGYIYKWDGYTLTEIMNVYEQLGTGAYPTEIEWNGEYALIGFSFGSSHAPLYKYDGNTFTDLSAQANFPALQGIREISWNGTHFLISSDACLKLYDQTNFTTLDYGTKWNAIEWNGFYWMLGGRTGTEYKLKRLDTNGLWTDYSPAIWFEPTAICPGALIVYVTSEPEIGATFTFAGKTYTTPVVVACYAGSHTVNVLDLFKEVNGTKLAFTHMVYSASPAVEIYSASAELQIANDGNLTLVYFPGAPKVPEKEPYPTPEPTEGNYCLPLIFYIIMVTLAFFGLYLFSQRETWKISLPLILVALWLLIFQPKTPVDQMPITFLRYFVVPPWHLYMGAILAVIACVALLSRKGK